MPATPGSTTMLLHHSSQKRLSVVQAQKTAHVYSDCRFYHPSVEYGLCPIIRDESDRLFTDHRGVGLGSISFLIPFSSLQRDSETMLVGGVRQRWLTMGIRVPHIAQVNWIELLSTQSRILRTAVFDLGSDMKEILVHLKQSGFDCALYRLQKDCFSRVEDFWMNKADIETMSIDDLYNNFKIVEQDVKKSVGASSGAQNLAFMTAPSTSSTNDVNTANPAYEVSTVSPNINTACPQVSTANFSDNTVYAFMVENPNGSNLLQQDLEQIHEDDLEAMDLKWQLSLLSMRAKRYFQRTGKKIFINANDTAGYDKSKVECFNCHKMGHFARECRAPRNKEGQFKYQDNTRKQGNNEDTSSKAMLAIDGVGFDWSDIAEEQIPTNIALMAFSDSEVYNDKTYTKTSTYKRGLATVEEQLITYRKNEVLFSEEVAVLKREVACKDYEINVLKSEFEKVKQEKEGIEFKIEKFDNASKSLNKLLESQITDKSKKGLGYNVVPPPHPLIYNRPKKLDFSYSGLDEFKDPEFKSYGSEDSEQESNIVCDKTSDDSKENSDDSLVKEQVSEDTSSFVESSLNVDKETIFLVDKKIEFVKPKNHEKPVKKLVRYAEMNRSQSPRWNQRNWNGQKSNQLGSDFVMYNKACFICGSFDHVQAHWQATTGFHWEFDGGYVTFGGGAHGGRISSKRTLKTDSLDFEDILLKIPRNDNMYSFDMKNIVPKESLTCLVAKATSDESMLWHRRLGHINFKNINKLVKDNLVRGILKNFIKEIENLVDKKVKIIRSDNGTEFKNKVMDDFCREKGIKREYSVARTPQQNGVAERRNRTLIEAARTMLADSKLPTTFWAEAVSTACYVQNRVLVVKPHNKTPYELFRGKFDGKSDEGFFVGYSLSSKAFRVYNTRTRKVEENLHIGFLENKPMIEGNGPKWLFDIDSLTQSMNYVPVAAGTITNESAGTQGELNAGTSTQKEEISQDCIVMPIWKDASYFDSPSKDVGNGEPKSAADDQKQVEDGPDNENDEKDKSEDDSSPKEVNTAGQHVNTASPEVNTGRFKLNTVDPSVNTASSYDPDSPKDMFKMGASHTLEATHVEFFSDEDEPEVDLGNILNSYTVPTTPNTRIHKDHPIKNVIGDVKSSVQTRRMTKPTSKQGFLSVVYKEKSHDTLNTCLYACFLSQIEPTSIAKALSDSSWVEAMQEELLQFKLQQVWILVDLPIGKRAIGTKWVFRNKKDERGIVIRNKARLVAQGHRQEEGIDYEEVFAPVARIKAIRLFLAYASFMGFLVYQMDMKSAFLYGTIEKEVYVTQPPGFKDLDNPNKVYKVVKALYGLHQAPRAWYETLANYLLGNGFKRGKIDQTLFIKKQKGDILLVQVYVDDIIFSSTNKELCTGFEKLMKDKLQMSSMGELNEILKKFNYTDVKSASTPVDLEKPLVKDGDANDVDVHIYRSMIASLIYLKGKPTLGLWYSRDSPFELVAYTDNDYVGATQDRKSTTGGCQFLGNRLISWQCKKQTVVATSTTEAKYVAAASCYGQASQKEVGTLRYLSLVVPLKKVDDEAVHKELGDRMERVATTASSLEAE
ncbi:retrotransposon protein, putative, ty1-copia subclass [Tanacetum coccineum]